MEPAITREQVLAIEKAIRRLGIIQEEILNRLYWDDSDSDEDQVQIHELKDEIRETLRDLREAIP